MTKYKRLSLANLRPTEQEHWLVDFVVDQGYAVKERSHLMRITEKGLGLFDKEVRAS